MLCNRCKKDFFYKEYVKENDQSTVHFIVVFSHNSLTDRTSQKFISFERFHPVKNLSLEWYRDAENSVQCEQSL